MKKNFAASILAIFCTFTLLFNSCTDPLDVGTELLEEDRARVGFSDTLQLVMRTELGDSVRVASNVTAVSTTYLFGRTQDPYFGITEGGIYLETLPTRDLGGNFIPFAVSSSATLDSVVLVLPIDSTNIFGMVDQPFSMEVYEVTERIDVPEDDNGIKSFFSNVSFATNPMPIGSASFIPNYTDTAFVSRSIDAVTLDTVDLKSQHVRIPLDNAFGQQFLNQDSLVFTNDSTLLDFFRGFYLKPTGTSAGLMNFAINKAWTGVYFYFKDGQDTLTYNLATGLSSARRINTYQHDYTGAIVEPFINTPMDQDTLVFLQGLQGLQATVEAPNIKDFAGKVINKAELELTVATFPDYNLDFFPPVQQIAAFKRNLEGDLVAISDVNIVPNDLGLYFGGRPEAQADGSFTYTMNLSIHSQYIIDNSEPETIYLIISPRTGNANRVIFKGPGAIKDAPILKLSFTDI